MKAEITMRTLLLCNNLSAISPTNDWSMNASPLKHAPSLSPSLSVFAVAFIAVVWHSLFSICLIFIFIVVRRIQVLVLLPAWNVRTVACHLAESCCSCAIPSHEFLMPPEITQSREPTSNEPDVEIKIFPGLIHSHERCVLENLFIYFSYMSCECDTLSRPNSLRHDVIQCVHSEWDGWQKYCFEVNDICRRKWRATIQTYE